MSPSGRASAGLHKTIPALPVRDVSAAVVRYRERFGFEPRYEASGFAVVVRDDAVLHLWGATDEDWRSRAELAAGPVCSGAESFLAGTASCRIEAIDVDALFEELQEQCVLHPSFASRCRGDGLWHTRVRHRRPRRQPGDVLPLGGGLEDP